MPATPAATNQQTASNGVAIGGRLSVALLEVKRRLEAELPGFIDYQNTQLGLIGNRAIQQFAGIDIAPDDLTKGHINHCLIGASVRFDAQGSRGFRGVGILSIYLIEPRWSVSEQYLGAIDRAGCVRMLLHNYITGPRNPQGRKVWNELTPMSEEPLPEKWRSYAGITLPYQVLQSAGENLWLP